MTATIYFTCKCDPRPFPVTEGQLVDAEGCIECDMCGRMCDMHAALITNPRQPEQFYVAGHTVGTGKSVEFEPVLEPFTGVDCILLTFRDGFDVATLSVAELEWNDDKPPFLWSTPRTEIKYLLPEVARRAKLDARTEL